MSEALYASVSRIARHEARARAVAAVGRVTDVMPAGGQATDHAVTVELRDSGLVLPRVPVAVGVLGFAAIPELGDLVVVLFLDGDANAPVVVGRLYHPDQDPPDHDTGELVLRLPSGGAEPGVDVSVRAGEPAVDLRLPGDVHVALRDGRTTITVGQMAVGVDGSGRIDLTAGGTEVVLKQDGDVALRAAGNIELEATEIRLKGQVKVSVKGTLVELN